MSDVMNGYTLLELDDHLYALTPETVRVKVREYERKAAIYRAILEVLTNDSDSERHVSRDDAVVECAAELCDHHASVRREEPRVRGITDETVVGSVRALSSGDFAGAPGCVADSLVDQRNGDHPVKLVNPNKKPPVKQATAARTHRRQQVKAALVALGSATPRQIADYTNVPYENIYACLMNGRGLHFVEVSRGLWDLQHRTKQ